MKDNELLLKKLKKLKPFTRKEDWRKDIRKRKRVLD